MKQINLEFNDFYDNWLKIIIQGLREHDIVFDEQLPINICNSVKSNVRAFIINLGYSPKNTIYYRVNFLNRLRNNGLDLVIQSNELLWKYLEYFTDLDNYDKCFDIRLIVINKEKAAKSTIIKNSNAEIILTQPIHKEDTEDINRDIKNLQNSNNISLNDILNILYKINNKGD